MRYLPRLRIDSRGRRGLGIACDCGDSPSPLVAVAVALAGGAAPVLATYLLAKLNPEAFTVEEVPDE